ncbi:SCO family protein [Croceiramulus getboli]|nr:SCO family protein [Flavobacteriaceae bacterium YJPT1-3]
MKKNNAYIGITFVILVFGIIFIPRIVERIQQGTTSESTRLNVGRLNESKVDNSGALAYIQVDGKDRKVPSFEFVNQRGDTISNTDLRGKVYVVEFFFTRCTNICIPMNSNLLQLSNTFKAQPNFAIASFTIDPNYDTPEVLQQYAEDYGVTHPNWHFLTGEREALFELANNGFNLLAVANPQVQGGFEHSGYFALIDQNGFIRSRYDKFGNPKIYYRGSVPEGAPVPEGGQESEIGILEEDIRKLLEQS